MKDFDLMDILLDRLSEYVATVGRITGKISLEDVNNCLEERNLSLRTRTTHSDYRYVGRKDDIPWYLYKMVTQNMLRSY